jgi:hypothetical protein
MLLFSKNLKKLKNLVETYESILLSSNQNQYFIRQIKPYSIQTSHQQTSLNKILKKSSLRKWLMISLIPTSGLLVYYQFLLNSQEKRRVQVNVSSFGRALRLINTYFLMNNFL